MNNSYIQKTALIAASLALGGCGLESSSASSMQVATPSILLQTRAIDSTQVRPIVTLSNGQQVTMARSDDGSGWTGNVSVPPDQSYVVTVLWVENYQSRDLQLLRLDQTITVTPDNSEFTLDAARYTNNIDDDGDGATNLDERIANTDPYTQEGGQPDEDQPGIDIPTPLDPLQPTPPVNPTEPEEPTEPQEPIDPEEPTEPEEPIDPEEPTEPEEPIDPDEPPTPDNTNVDLFIPRIAQSLAPTIDGLNVIVDNNGLFTGEWAAAGYLETSGVPLTVSNLMIDLNNAETNAANYRKWAAMHDGEYLYIVVTVDDDGARFRDSGSEVWQDDSLEIFIDGNNSKLTSYDGVDDYQFTFPVRGSGASKQAVTSGEVIGQFNPTSAEIDFATGPGVGPDGLRRANFEQDVYELRLSLDSLGIAVNQPFGLEVQINDDDDGEERDSKWGWHHPARVNTDVDETFENPSFMGTARLD